MISRNNNSSLHWWVDASGCDTQTVPSSSPSIRFLPRSVHTPSLTPLTTISLCWEPSWVDPRLYCFFLLPVVRIITFPFSSTSRSLHFWKPSSTIRDTSQLLQQLLNPFLLSRPVVPIWVLRPAHHLQSAPHPSTLHRISSWVSSSCMLFWSQTSGKHHDGAFDIGQCRTSRSLVYCTRHRVWLEA